MNFPALIRILLPFATFYNGHRKIGLKSPQPCFLWEMQIMITEISQVNQRYKFPPSKWGRIILTLRMIEWCLSMESSRKWQRVDSQLELRKKSLPLWKRPSHLKRPCPMDYGNNALRWWPMIPPDRKENPMNYPLAKVIHSILNA